MYKLQMPEYKAVISCKCQITRHVSAVVNARLQGLYEAGDRLRPGLSLQDSVSLVELGQTAGLQGGLALQALPSCPAAGPAGVAGWQGGVVQWSGGVPYVTPASRHGLRAAQRPQS